MSASDSGRAFLPVRRSSNIQPSSLFRTNAAGGSFQRRKPYSACRCRNYHYTESNCFCSADFRSSLSPYRTLQQPEITHAASKNTHEPEILPEKSRTFYHVKGSIAYRSCSGGFLRNHCLYAVFNCLQCTGAFPHLSRIHADGSFAPYVDFPEIKPCRSTVSHGAFSGKITFPYNFHDNKIHERTKKSSCRTGSCISSANCIGNRTSRCLHTPYDSGCSMHFNLYQRGRI